MIWDLDGTLRETASGETFINEPTDQKPMLGASEALAYYRKSFVCIGATNQGGCAVNPVTGKSRKSIENMIQEQQITLGLFPQLECIYACPDFEGEICWKISRLGSAKLISRKSAKCDSFRKPGSGMVQVAIETFGEAGEDFWMIGDRPEDKGCAETGKINFMWADIVRNKFIAEHEQIAHIDRVDREVLLKFLAI